MKAITRDMIKIYRLRKVGIDFMGYSLQRGGMPTFHHLKVKKCDGGAESIENGAVLMQDTSHPYIHLIEMKDLDMYYYLRDILIEINKQCIYPSEEQIRLMHDVLDCFERDYGNATNRKGKQLIKYKYKQR